MNYPVASYFCCFKPEELFTSRDFEHSLGPPVSYLHGFPAGGCAPKGHALSPLFLPNRHDMLIIENFTVTGY
jgi:hypothetical protein